jgi:hypothetical protein
MHPLTLRRWSGLAFAIGGVSIAGFYVGLVPTGGPGGATAQDTSAPAYLIAHGLHTVGGVLTLLGLVGFYLSQAERTGKIGFAGFVLAFIGTAFYAGLGMIAEFVAPALAARAPELGAPERGPLVPLAFVPFLVGYVLLGAATLRSGTGPRAGAIAFILAAVLVALPWPWPLNLIGGVVFAFATLSVGLALASGTTTSAGSGAARA